jgi:hypothetical protein
MLKFEPRKLFRSPETKKQSLEVVFIDVGYAPVYALLWIQNRRKKVNKDLDKLELELRVTVGFI